MPLEKRNDKEKYANDRQSIRNRTEITFQKAVIDPKTTQLKGRTSSLFAELNLTRLQEELVRDVQELNRGIGVRISTEPGDPTTAQLPALSPSQETSQLQRDQVSNINPQEMVTEEAPLTRVDTADDSQTVPMVATAPTSAEKCAGVFKTRDPINKESLGQGACKLHREQRGETPTQIQKNKDLHAQGILYKIRLHKF